MFRVTANANIYCREVIGFAPDLAAAKAMIPGEIHFMEEDPDHPGCYDLINHLCDVYCIEIVHPKEELK